MGNIHMHNYCIIYGTSMTGYTTDARKPVNKGAVTGFVLQLLC